MTPSAPTAKPTSSGGPASGMFSRSGTSGRRAPIPAACIGLLLASVTGCADLPTELEEVTAVAEEIGGAISGTLPVPPHLVRYGLRGVSIETVERWEASWRSDDRAIRQEAFQTRKGAELRAELRAELAARLAETASLDLLAVEVPRLEARLAAIADRAARLPAWSRLPDALEGARASLARAADPELGPERRWAEWLEAGDRLWPWSPTGRARVLLDRCPLGRSVAGRPYSELEAAAERAPERAAELRRGVETALRAGDPLRALRRAWYACGVLGVQETELATDTDEEHR